jgi:hypothetical protein
MLTSGLEGHLAGGASWGFSFAFLSPGLAGTLLGCVLEHLRFQLHHPSMHFVFDFHKGGFGVGFAPLFHLAQNLRTLGKPGVLFHDLLFLVSFFGSLILPKVLVLSHPIAKT